MRERGDLPEKPTLALHRPQARALGGAEDDAHRVEARAERDAAGQEHRVDEADRESHLRWEGDPHRGCSGVHRVGEALAREEAQVEMLELGVLREGDSLALRVRPHAGAIRQIDAERLRESQESTLRAADPAVPTRVFVDDREARVATNWVNDREGGVLTHLELTFR